MNKKGSKIIRFRKFVYYLQAQPKCKGRSQEFVKNFYSDQTLFNITAPPLLQGYTSIKIKTVRSYFFTVPKFLILIIDLRVRFKQKFLLYKTPLSVLI